MTWRNIYTDVIALAHEKIKCIKKYLMMHCLEFPGVLSQ